MTPRLPDHAKEFFSKLPWDSATWTNLTLQGLMFNGVAQFASGAVILTTDDDIDTDGPGGSKQQDQSWQGETSLRWPDGTSIDSRRFPGMVLPPALKEFGVRLGDFGFCFWRGAMASFQMFDIGPSDKAGESTVYLARAMGVIPSTASDHKAATYGDTCIDLVSVIFPRTAPGSGENIANHAVEPRLIHKIVQNLIARDFPGVVEPW